MSQSIQMFSLDCTRYQETTLPAAKHDQALLAIREHILHIAQTDPQQASRLSHRVVVCNWTSREIEQLRALGLPVQGLQARPGLLGGVGEELVIEALKGSIHLLKDGNFDEMNSAKEDRTVRAHIELPDGNVVEGVHTGCRVLSDPEYGCLCLCPKYALLASGPGEFIANRITYRGNFYKNLFHDNTGEAVYFIASDLKYTGGFEVGKRSGIGRLERYNRETGEFYLYYQGTWRNDAPDTGTYHTPEGEQISVEMGMISTVHSSPATAHSSPSVPPIVQPTPSAPLSRQVTPPPVVLQRYPSIALDHNDLLRSKLQTPSLELSLEESVTLLTDCIQYGLVEASKARNQDILIFIGNTGSGKSTMVNYLAGCTMLRKSPKELGITALGKVVVVQPVSEGGALQEIMPIGHEKTSKTFMPQIETDRTQDLTYCDCPGFLDNRGAEVNIANAVNIKNALLQARSIRAMILINYHSLQADRGRGLSEMLQIASHLFGQAKNLIQNKQSLLVGITKTPFEMSLMELREWIQDSKLPVMEALADRVFISDPLDAPLEGGWNRAAVLEHIQQLTPMLHPEKIFNTVLTDSDETTLIRISEGMRASIQKALQAGEFAKAAKQLTHFHQLRVIDHITVERLLSQAERDIEQQFQQWATQFKAYCHFGQFLQAQATLRRLEEALGHFDPELQRHISLPELRQYYRSCEQRTQEAERKEKAYQEQIRQANLRIEEFIALLDEQKKNTEKQLREQQRHFEEMRLEMQKNIDTATRSYEAMKIQLMQEMEHRLKQKEEELETTQAQGSRETQERLEQERTKLRSEYEHKLQEMEEQKKLFLATQQKEREAQEKQRAQEQAALEAKLKELDAQKQVQAAQRIEPPARSGRLPAIAFGAAEWAKYFGNVGAEPPLPSNIDVILDTACPFWPDKRVRETHLLVLVPETVDGRPLTLKTLGELIQNPRQGHKTKYYGFCELGRYQDVPTPRARWVLMTRDILPGSRGQSLRNQQDLVDRHSHYEVPHVLDAAVCVLMEYVRTGTRLYSNEFTHCQEEYNNEWQMSVGDFSSRGLLIRSAVYYDLGGYGRFGVGAVRKFP